MTDFIDATVLNVDVDKESNIDPANRNLIKNLTKSVTLEEFDSKLTSCVSLEARIHLVQQFYEWTPISADTIGKYSKSSQISSMFREKGNASFKEKSFQDALLDYNLAILFAPCKSEGLGLAYANRAAVLMQMEDFESALLDIRLALDEGYPVTQAGKLEERRFKCENKLKEQEKKRHAEVEAEQLKRRKFCEGILFKVKKPNERMKAAEDFVRIKYEEGKGRYLVVNRDIPAGTVLIVERPYVSVLKDEVKWDTRHCHYCLRSIRRGIPCENCVFAFYCDSSCRSAASSEYHKFECPCLPYLHVNSSPRWIFLVFRTICRTGPYELLRIFTTQDPQYHSTSPFGTEPSCTYESDSYLPIYHLVTHSNELDGGARYANALQALLLTSILETQSSSFFSQVPAETKDSFRTFVATLMLRHIESIPCNAISLDEVKGLDDITLSDCHGNDSRVHPDRLAAKIRHIEFPQFAAGVYSVCSLMNHSCDPNVDRQSDVSGGVLSVVATRALKEGEPILTCYSRNFASDPLEARQSSLMENYWFKCECIACKYDWPRLEELTGREPIFCCPSCSPKFCHELKGSQEFKKCCLSAQEEWKCGLCGAECLEKQLRGQFDANMVTTFEAYELVLRNRAIEAIRKLTGGPMKYFQFNVCPPFSKFYWNQETYKQALALIVYFSV